MANISVKMTPQNTIQVTEYTINRNSVAFGDLSDVDLSGAVQGMVPVLSANGKWVATASLSDIEINGGFF